MMQTAATIAHDLATLGVQPGRALMVHASLRRLGPVEGGADAVIDALQEVLGPTGTLLMVLGADADDAFDRFETEVDVEDMGWLAEVFRKRDGVHVNDHAAARYGAWGKDAELLIDNAPLHDYHGPGSPLARLYLRDGDVLRLGADVDTVTLTHFAEYLADVPNKRRVSRGYVRADTGPQQIESLDDNDGIVEWADGDYFSTLLEEYLQRDEVNRGPVGACNAELMRARPFVDFAVTWMETRLT